MTQSHYELVKKYQAHRMMDFGTKFKYKGMEYEVIGATPAGDKYRAKDTTGKVLRFDIKGFERKYGIKIPTAHS